MVCIFNELLGSNWMVFCELKTIIWETSLVKFISLESQQHVLFKKNIIIQGYFRQMKYAIWGRINMWKQEQTGTSAC